MRPVFLIVMDGVGHGESVKGNAVIAASTPNIDSYRKKYPSALLDASGEAVGLPAGYQGSSEVGHLSMGAGRIIEQELKRIDDGLSNGSLFKKSKWKALVDSWATGGRLHLFGLLQDEGVHAHQEHLFKIMRQGRLENQAGEIIVHPFLDGRDTPPRSSLEYLAALRRVMGEVGNCRIGTIMGRYYGMDRSKNWKLTDTAFNCIVHARGRRADSPEEAIRTSYEQDRTPDGVEMFDEYIVPHVIEDYRGMKDGDSVFHTNYRQDRAIQLTRAFVDPGYPGDIENRPDITYLAFTRYYDQLEEYLLEDMGSQAAMNNLVGEVISRAGLKQLRISETQKFRHVTSFFNGKATTPFENETRVEIKGRFDPASFARHPEMEAYNVTDTLIGHLKENVYSFILVNYANGDMVGHTGDFEAARKAVGIVDECVGRLVNRALELDGHVILTADHGNSDQMLDPETGQIKTSHSTNPVECFYIARDADSRKLVPRGILPGIGPAVLTLMGLPVPAEMTAPSLFED